MSLYAKNVKNFHQNDVSYSPFTGCFLTEDDAPYDSISAYFLKNMFATPPFPQKVIIFNYQKISCYMTKLANDHQYLCITIFAPF